MRIRNLDNVRLGGKIKSGRENLGVDKVLGKEKKY